MDQMKANIQFGPKVKGQPANMYHCWMLFFITTVRDGVERGTLPVATHDSNSPSAHAVQGHWQPQRIVYSWTSLF